MKTSTAAIALLIGLGSAPASAQVYFEPYASVYSRRGYDEPMAKAPTAAVPAGAIPQILRSQGFVPIGKVEHERGNYAMRAMDNYGRTVRVIIDAQYGEVVAIHPVAARAPQGGYPEPRAYPGPRPYPPHYGALPPDYEGDDDFLPPPGMPPGPRPPIARPPMMEQSTVAPNYRPQPRRAVAPKPVASTKPTVTAKPTAIPKPTPAPNREATNKPSPPAASPGATPAASPAAAVPVETPAAPAVAAAPVEKPAKPARPEMTPVAPLN